MASGQRSRRTILLIEDDEAIAALIGEVLVEEGYATTAATTVAAGLALLRRQRFDLILADAFAGDGLGEKRWQSLEQIRRAAGETPTIILTAHRAAQFGDYARRGYAAIMEKPFDLDALLALLDRLLRERHHPAIPCGDRGGD